MHVDGVRLYRREQLETLANSGVARRTGNLGYRIRFPYVTDYPWTVDQKNVIAAALKRAGFDPQPVPSTQENYSATSCRTRGRT